MKSSAGISTGSSLIPTNCNYSILDGTNLFSYGENLFLILLGSLKMSVSFLFAVSESEEAKK